MNISYTGSQMARSMDKEKTSTLSDDVRQVSINIDDVGNMINSNTAGDDDQIDSRLLPLSQKAHNDEETSPLINDSQGNTTLAQTCIDIDREDEHKMVVPLVFLRPLQTDSDRVKPITNRARETITPHNINSVVTAREQKNTYTQKSGEVPPVTLNDTRGATEHPSDETSSPNGREVFFLVGEGRQRMTGRDSQLTAISPVFQAMCAERWKGTHCDSAMVAEIPDVDASTFAVILRCSQGEDDLQLTEENVWHVLITADRYQVSAVVDRCFHYLLHQHPRRHRSRHLCGVVETAHRFNYTQHYEEGVSLIKQNAGRVFKNASALSELCQHCMLRLVMADDLASPVPEIRIHDAVVTWAVRACAAKQRGEETKAPSLETLRATAGPLMRHVRYLTMPQRTLKTLGNKSGGRGGGGGVSSLLTGAELRSLLEGDTGDFPETVKVKRHTAERRRVSLCSSSDRMDRSCVIVLVFALFLLFLFAVVYVPTMYIVQNL